MSPDNSVVQLIIQSLSTILAALIGALLAWKVFSSGKKADTARERLNAVYAEAFKIIEPVMYRIISREDCNLIVSKLDDIAKSGGVLTDPKLSSLIERYTKSPEGDKADYPNYKYSRFSLQNCYLEKWFDICENIEQTYDQLCKQSFLPLRSVAYRLERNQYINGWRWFLNFLKIVWPGISLFILLFALVVLSTMPVR